jgi:hypothetical protein
MTLAPGITVVTPTIPPRAELADRCARSVFEAVSHLAHQADELGLPEGFQFNHHGVVDEDHKGAARTRHTGLMAVETEWVAFLDDDDVMLANHLTALYAAAVVHNADYLWSRFLIKYPDGSSLPGPAFLGQKAFSPWNDADPCQTTITTLVRTELARAAGGFAQFEDDGTEVDGQRRGEDHEFTLRCRAAGGEFHHVAEVTWHWNHWGIGGPGVPGNTSGMPDRW